MNELTRQILKDILREIQYCKQILTRQIQPGNTLPVNPMDSRKRHKLDDTPTETTD